jgi:hypothetical protein
VAYYENETRTSNWHYWLGAIGAIFLLALLGIGVKLHAQKSRIPPVPPDIQIKILKIQKDQIAQSSRMQLIQQAANETNAAAQKDAIAIDEATRDALKGAGLDPAKWALSVEGETMTFVEKKEAAKGPAPTTSTTPPSAPSKK